MFPSRHPSVRCPQSRQKISSRFSVLFAAPLHPTHLQQNSRRNEPSPPPTLAIVAAHHDNALCFFTSLNKRLLPFPFLILFLWLHKTWRLPFCCWCFFVPLPLPVELAATTATACSLWLLPGFTLTFAAKSHHGIHFEHLTPSFDTVKSSTAN